MRLIHTADLHLDAAFAEAGMPPEYGKCRREALRAVFGRILLRAAEWPADAVLIAGDLFEHERAGRETVAFLRERFEEIRPIPVFIAPGNRDPYMGASPYASEAWPANVYVFAKAEWSTFELKQTGLSVHGFAFDGHAISENPFGTLSVPDDGRVHVAVAHGSEEGLLPEHEPGVAPFDAATAFPPGLHYAALGHYHETIQVLGGKTVAWYSGSPEGHGFGELGERYYLEVEILTEEGGGVPVSVSPVSAASCVHELREVACDGLEDGQALLAALRPPAGERDRGRIARVTLTGTCSAALRDAMPLVREEICCDFEFVEIVDGTERREDDPDLALDDTSLGLFSRRICEEIRDAPDARRRRVLVRAKEAGEAAFRDRPLPVSGLDRSLE